jgi:hypothetical protein
MLRNCWIKVLLSPTTTVLSTTSPPMEMLLFEDGVGCLSDDMNAVRRYFLPHFVIINLKPFYLWSNPGQSDHVKGNKTRREGFACDIRQLDVTGCSCVEPEVAQRCPRVVQGDLIDGHRICP